MINTYRITLKISGVYFVPDPWDGDRFGCGPTCSSRDCEQVAVVIVSAPSLGEAIDAAISYDYKPESFDASGSRRVVDIKYLSSESDEDDVCVEVEYIEEIPDYDD